MDRQKEYGHSHPGERIAFAEPVLISSPTSRSEMDDTPESGFAGLSHGPPGGMNTGLTLRFFGRPMLAGAGNLTQNSF
jgi:hypothetical protein